MEIVLERGGDAPLYLQIYRQLRGQITSGQRRAGERLPATRELAAQLKVGRNTVENAYAQLLVEGYVNSRRGSGYTVQPLQGLSAPRERRQLSPAVVEAGEWAYDFQYGQLMADDFPLGLWRRLTQQALDVLGPRLTVYGDGRGEYGLRRELCGYLYRSRGVMCEPEQIVVCAGTTYALTILGQLLRPKYGEIAVEDPGYINARLVFSKCGFSLLPIPVGDDGMEVTALAESGAKLVYTTPSHQFPGGVVLSVPKRHQLLNWAQENGGIILEDDYDSEFRYHTRPVPPVASLPSGAQVVYMGTLSKILSPGLRISFLVLPPALAGAYAAAFSKYPASVSVIEQKVLELFLSSEQWEAYLRRASTANRRRHDALVQAVRERLGDRFAMLGENAGLHVLLQSRNGLTEEALIARAGAFGVKVYPVSDHWMQGARYSRDMVLMGFGSMDEESIRAGIARLDEAWNTVR